MSSSCQETIIGALPGSSVFSAAESTMAVLTRVGREARGGSPARAATTSARSA
ncbi:MAG TPA: hypothetical protein VNM90_08105 [Haliangium sp.]|nr:hypothetical protein [Haliangium sp.]